MVGGVAGHPDGDAVGMAVCLGLVGAQMGRGGGDDGDGELLVDLPDERVEIGFARLAFSSGNVVDVLAP